MSGGGPGARSDSRPGGGRPAPGHAPPGAGAPAGEVAITLEVYFRFRGQAFYRGEERIPAGMTVPALAERIGLGGRAGVAVIVNGRHHPDDRPLRHGDLVTFVRRSEGGRDQDRWRPRLPVIGVTMGDPAGIGPEIVIKACVSPDVTGVCQTLVLGDVRALEHTARACGLQARFRPVRGVAEARFEAGVIDVLDFANVGVDRLQFGEAQGMCGVAAVQYVERSVELCLSGEIDAVATAPIHKEALKAGGLRYTDHTEIYGKLTGTPEPLTMFEVLGLRIFFLTRHVPLAQACAMIRRERVLDYLERCTAALDRLGLHNPTIAVAGLNPHAGDHGLFGREEIDEIEPAVAAAKARGLRAAGPLPADSVFHQALRGRYDAVLSLYHDQGHIAAKMVDFERTVSLTLGLPFLRTSVDHGTAFDIAGRGIASQVSMVEAIRAAARYAPRFRRP